jgi:DNA-binding MarR family transcriptional regulator
MTAEREANVLGALAQAIADQTAGAITAATGQSPTAAAALTALDQFLDRPTLDRLRLVLGLTPSGAVRLVDRLSDAGLVARTPGADGRSRAVVLTDQGRVAAAQVAAARSATLHRLLAGFAPDELAVLGKVLDRLMAGVVNVKDGGAWICRQCDFAACERAEGRCPAANAAAQRRV